MEHSLARREMEPPTVTTMRQLALSCDHPPRVCLLFVCLRRARLLMLHGSIPQRAWNKLVPWLSLNPGCADVIF